MISREQVTEALRKVVDPCSIATGAPIDLVDMGMLRGISIDGSHVEIQLRFTSPLCWQASNIIKAIEDNLMRIEGVERVTCDTRSGAWEWKPEMMAASAQARLRRLRPMPQVRMAGLPADHQTAGPADEAAPAAGPGGPAAP
jgi:metal-sulfur cluster biosynthetic enzyme